MAPSPRPDFKLAPTSEEASIHQRPLSGEEVVIAGMSGKFPESPNIHTFMENLYNKEDMVTGDTRRWDLDHPEIPQRTGKIDCYNKFDAQFFGVHYKQAWTMEPMSRMLLENTYGAIFDAGINPRTLKNTKTGVFIGSSFSEIEKTFFYEKLQVNGFGITGCSRSMYANRISYWLGSTGPSYCVDSACSSSLLALEHAYRAIRSGQCDAAIVGGVNLCLQPYVSLQFRRLGYISMDGKTKSFDKNADGYARAESIGVLFLQRAKNAKRVYTELAHVKTNTEGPLSLAPRTADCIERFLNEFYGEISVLPKQVEFVEAFGSGMAQSDVEELKAYDRVFCKDRCGPVLVGSVKSNMGHSEPASGVNAVTKICLAYHRGEIAPNLHYQEPRSDVAGVREGRIRIVTEPTPFSGGYTAASSYSFSGVNVHALFKGYATKKQLGNVLKDDLPRLVVASGRSESAIKRIFKDVSSRPIDPEQVRLLHNIFESELPGHMYRGFDLIKLKEGETVSMAQHVDYFPGLKRPVWFVYSGMGSQWSGMGAHLMRIPIFAAAIERCCRALAPKGLDLMHILTDPDPTIYNNILHSFVGIAAVQIGLTDVLTALGIKPDNIIGHSVGELGCAYADGCFTADEMILSAYSRGLVSIQTPFIRGSMAAVGRGFKEMKTRCPPEIEVACHNGPDSCTISGPADIMKTFVGELTAEGIFAKEVPCSNIAYHSRYIAEAGPNLLKYLQQVIPEPKARSARWLSTSVPENKWEEKSAQLSSAEYHTNNLLSPVLFEETSRQIPQNAITIEVAPHGLLQAILRRSLSEDCTNVPLTRRGHTDNVEYLLNAIGNLYEVGLNPQVANIYPEVKFPVSVDTPMMSHLVEWEHSEDWYAPKFLFPSVNCSGERDFAISTCDQEYQFLTGHMINGTNVIPPAEYLVLAWETLGMMLGYHYTTLSVVFENITFCGDWPLHRNKTVPFNIMIHKGNGYFEVAVEGNKLATGTIKAHKSSLLLQNELAEPEKRSDDDIVMSEEDVYRVFAAKGHSYSGLLRGIQQTDLSATRSVLKWRENWACFLDSMMQLEALHSEWGGITKPKGILRLTLNTKKHRRALTELPEDNKYLPCTAYYVSDTRRCGGAELFGFKVEKCQKFTMYSTLIHKYEFVSSTNTKLAEIKEAVRTQVQLALLNTNEASFNVLEIVDVDKEDSLEPIISEVLKDTPHATNGHHVKILTARTESANTPVLYMDEVKNADLVITSNISHYNIMHGQILDSLRENAFVLSRENRNFNEKVLGNKFDLVSVSESSESCLVLLKKRSAMSCSRRTKYITVKSSSKLAWLQLLQAEWRTCDRLVLVSECDPCAGLLGVFNCLRREPGGHVLTLLLIDDYSAPAFRPDLQFYQEQLSKNLAINVYRNGAWGSYQYLPLPPVSVQREHVYLSSQRPEDISSLAWLEGPLTLDSAPSHPTKKLVQVYYSSLSHIDMQMASGRLQFEDSKQQERSSGYGMDFCGRTSTGERVMGLVRSGALSSLVEADVDMLWPVPPHWSMEDAATVPLAYANAFYCLDMAEMSIGYSVLIHNGTDPLSQAAISVCLGMGFIVYTTVDSIHKKQWLLKAFPTLKEWHVGNSNDDSFEYMVMNGTKGKGCIAIMSTLTEKLHNVSLRCTGYGGTFINLNLEEISDNKALGMYIFTSNRRYRAPNISNIFLEKNTSIKKKVQHMLAEGIIRGYVQPLSRVVLDASEAPRAFRFTSTGRHVGKVLLKLRDEELRPLVTPSRALLAAQPHFLCSGDGNYLIILGSEYSGLELADWLIQRGARNLVLHSPRLASDSGYHTFRVRCWRRQGVKIQLSAENLQTEVGCLQLLTDAAKHAPVLGLFVAPRSSYRELFEQSRCDRFAEDFAEKALIVMNLDSATRKCCPHLKQFVMWSSAAAGRGAAGCSSGSLADSVVERVCEERGKLGLPALAVQWDENENAILEDNAASVAYSSLDVLLTTTIRVAFAAKVTIPPRYRGVFDTVQDIIDVDLNSVPSEYNLEEISVTKLSAEQISQALRIHFQIYMTPEKILKTTLNEFKIIDEQAKNNDKSTGLGVFFSYIDPEEFNAAEELVGMATVVSSGTETECEFNKKDKHVILVPSMEGHRHIFPVVAQRLKVNSSSCQLGDDVTETIPDIAARLGKVILRKMEPDAKFSLVGYGFGVAVALEMASIFENHGHVGQVFCLDGSPRWFPVLLDAQLGHLSEQQLQNAVIEHMYCVMLASGGDGKGVEEEALQLLQRSLAAEIDWERKLDACMRHLRGQVKFSFQYQRSLLAMAYARIRQARAYSDAALLSRPLRSELVLLMAMRRPRSLSAAAEALGRDLGLGAYSQQPVAIHELDCDHAAAPFDLSVSDIINARVADLQYFKKLNLCIQYIPDTISRIF